MGRDGKYVVAYDLRDDGEREKVARILQGFGSRMKKCVKRGFLLERD
jgi:CRISPR/Cas system-associated endoribonuclease Cas2